MTSLPPSQQFDSQDVEHVAAAFHASYEDWAIELGWATQERSRTAWRDLPEANRATMLATVRDLLDQGVITIAMTGMGPS